MTVCRHHNHGMCGLRLHPPESLPGACGSCPRMVPRLPKAAKPPLVPGPAVRVRAVCVGCVRKREAARDEQMRKIASEGVP